MHDNRGMGNGLSPHFSGMDHKANSNVNFYSSIYSDLRNTTIPYSILPTNEITQYTEHKYNTYFFEPKNLKLFKDSNVFEHISDIAKKYIRNNKLRLVIYYPFEAFPVNQGLFKSEFLCPILRSAKQEHFPVDNITIFYGDLNVIENYKKTVKFLEEDGFERIFPLPYWEFHQQRYMKNNLAYAVPVENRVSKLDRPYKFLCFNGAARPHRFIAVSELERRNIIDQGLVSMIGRYGTHNLTEQPIRWPYAYFNSKDPLQVSMLDHLKTYLTAWKPRTLDRTFDEINTSDRLFDNQLYLKTFFSVVTETEMTNDVFFITEKSFHPMVNMHPFLMMGSCGTLAYLKKHGYETFPEFFDESYDSEPDQVKRIMMVLDELEKVCNHYSLNYLRKLYYRAWPKLVHNRNNFLTRKHIHEFERMFEIIFEK